ncbi:hypothetical protein CLU79DRAFT_774488 [Phycomyces nitens]|nr:hypothetical protein CLU79DRAFT_774488 [Phycomyces nitens]
MLFNSMEYSNSKLVLSIVWTFLQYLWLFHWCVLLKGFQDNNNNIILAVLNRV